MATPRRAAYVGTLPQAAAVPNAAALTSTTSTGGDAITDAEFNALRADVAALQTKLNALLAALRASNLLA